MKLRIPQSSSIAEDSTLDYLISCPGHSVEKSHPSAEMQSVFSDPLSDWASFSNELGLVFLWHINHCRLFNAKSSLYLYDNIFKPALLIVFFVFLHTRKLFQVFLCNTNNIIYDLFADS